MSREWSFNTGSTILFSLNRTSFEPECLFYLKVFPALKLHIRSLLTSEISGSFTLTAFLASQYDFKQMKGTISAR